MGTYLRWWSGGKPQHPLAVADEQDAKNRITSKFPNAVFRWSALEGDSGEHHIRAWENEEAFNRNADPIADILLTG
jgi:hypothetical protein